MPAVFRRQVRRQKMNDLLAASTETGHLQTAEKYLLCLKGREIQILRQNFIYMEEHMNESLQRKAQLLIDESECRLPDTTRLLEGKRKVLLCLLLTNNDTCHKFLKEMSNIGKIDQLRHLAASDKRIQLDNAARLQIKKSELLTHRNLLEDIEVDELSCLMLEYSVITIHEFLKVASDSSRRSQRKTLIDTLFAKQSDDWVAGFIFVLKTTNQDGILTSLKSQPSLEDAVHDIMCIPQSGHTERVISHLPVNVPVESLNRESNISEFIIEDIWQGSLYILIKSNSKQMSLLDRSIIEKLAQFFNQLFHTQEACRSLGTVETISVRLSTVSDNEFLGKEHGRTQMNIESQTCARCMKDLVCSHFDEFASEIETDIIVETLEKIKDASSFIKDKCLNKKKIISRDARAKNFLNYVLLNEASLVAFFTVFGRRSRMKIELPKCKHTKDTKLILRKGEDVTLAFKLDFCEGYVRFTPVDVQIYRPQTLLTIMKPRPISAPPERASTEKEKGDKHEEDKLKSEVQLLQSQVIYLSRKMEELASTVNTHMKHQSSETNA